MNRLIKFLIASIISVFVLSCSTGQKKPVRQYAKAEVAKFLPGTWQYLGFDVAPGTADTTYSEYPNRPGMEDYIVYGIKTDSGSYRHTYDESTHTLVKVEAESEVELVRFTVTSDSSGMMFPYHGTDSNDVFIGVATEYKLSWYDDEHGQTHLLIYGTLSNADNVIIAQLDDKEMALDWGENKIERYKRRVGVPADQ